MASKDFVPVLKATRTPALEKVPPFLELFLKDAFKLPTIVALGALLQTLIHTFLPKPYAIIPVVLIVLRSLIITVLQVRAPTTNPYINNIVPGRVTAQLPIKDSIASSESQSGLGRHFGNQAASQPLVVFHLGARINHPLGLFAPGARELGEHFQAMAASLSQRREHYGMLSITNWRGQERHCNNNLMIIAYFRSVDDLNRFAHDEVHRKGWDWYHRFVRETGYRHLGIFHETFVSRAGNYETIYIDTEPTLLGGADVRVAGGASEKDSPAREEWMKPLVSADHPALRSQAKRMGSMLGLKEEVVSA